MNQYVQSPTAANFFAGMADPNWSLKDASHYVSTSSSIKMGICLSETDGVWSNGWNATNKNEVAPQVAAMVVARAYAAATVQPQEPDNRLQAVAMRLQLEDPDPETTPNDSIWLRGPGRLSARVPDPVDLLYARQSFHSPVAVHPVVLRANSPEATCMNRITDIVPELRSLNFSGWSTDASNKLSISTVVEHFLERQSAWQAGQAKLADIEAKRSFGLDSGDPAVRLLLDSWWIPQSSVLLVPRIAIHGGNPSTPPVAEVNSDLPHWPRLAMRICDLANSLESAKVGIHAVDS